MEGLTQSIGGFLPFILIILVFYFFMIRPQMQKQKDRQKMLESLQKGDDVVTVGGVHGKVVTFKNDKKVVVVKVAEKLNLDVDRSAISAIKGKMEPETK